MAVAAKLRPSSSSPPPPPARRTVARLACTHLARSAIDAVFCLFLASAWLLFWGQATKEVGLLACGEGCAVVAAASEVASAAAGVVLVLLLPITVLLLLAPMVARSRTQAATTATDDIEAAKETARGTLEHSAMRDELCDDPVFLGFLALMVFTLIKLVGVLVKGDSPVMRSRWEGVGSVIYEVGTLGKYALDCFFLCPFVTVKIWRSWRMARRAVMSYAVETKP